MPLPRGEQPNSIPTKKWNTATVGFLVLALIVAIALVAYRLTDEPPAGAVVYRASLTKVTGVALLAMSLFGAGAWQFGSRSLIAQWRAAGLMISGMATMMLAMPGILLNRLTISDSGFEVRDVIPFGSSIDAAQFTDLQSIELRRGVFTGNNTKSLVLKLTDGTYSQISVDRVRDDAINAILPACSTHGIAIGPEHTS